MPPATRRPSRSSRSNSLHEGYKGAPNVGFIGQKRASSPTSFGMIEPPPIPKHFPFPNVPIDSDVSFELQMFSFAAIACGLQFLHLYRSVWWLPNSHSNSTMNFYLINGYLLVFIFIILSRRLLYAGGIYLAKWVEGLSVPNRPLAEYFISNMYFTFFWSQLTIYAFFVIGNRPQLNMLYLFYPILLYVLLFGHQIKPIFEAVGWCSGGKPPIHACSSSAEYIRNEAEILRVNFSDRMKQILFTSVVNAYYAGFIPCCFAQPQLQYDIYWATQHVFFIFFGTCAFSISHLLPLRYCDILHRSVLHLGEWERVEPGRSLLLVVHEWREDCIWPPNVLVKYRQCIWRSLGDCNSNVPGDKGLNKFYKMFVTPSNLKSLVLFFHMMIVFYQLVMLVKATHWYKIISLALMIFFNYFTLYKVVRDFLVSYRIYKEEKFLHEKYEKSNIDYR